MAGHTLRPAACRRIEGALLAAGAAFDWHATAVCALGCMAEDQAGRDVRRQDAHTEKHACQPVDPCAAVGGVTGAALGAIESSEWAGGGALVGAGMAAAYCWVHGAEEQVAVVEETVVEEVVADRKSVV